MSTTATLPTTDELVARVKAVVEHKKFDKVKNGAIRSALAKAQEDIEKVDLTYLTSKLDTAEMLLAQFDESTRVNRRNNLEKARAGIVAKGWFKKFEKSNPNEAKLLKQTVPEDADHELMDRYQAAVSTARETARSAYERSLEQLEGRRAKVVDHGDDFSVMFMEDRPADYAIIASPLGENPTNDQRSELNGAINAFYAWINGTDPSTERQLDRMGLAAPGASQGKSNHGKGKRRHR